MRLAGRTVFHAMMIGGAVGSVACGFFALLQLADHLLLEGIAGYRQLRPSGEHGFDLGLARKSLVPIALVLLPAFGGLVAGWLAFRIAHETSGGGGDAYIDGFHRRGGLVRKRVAWVKMVATAFTLGSGGSAGREGPTMQVGAALASLVSRRFDVSPRERRILMVAGTAAGLSAMFGTPLGAAIFATEVLYRDDFESDALVPAVLASVTSYSIFVTAFPGHGELFAHAPRYPFAPLQLPLFAALAVVVSIFARVFVRSLDRTRKVFASSSVPVWARPAVGGLSVGLLAVSWILVVNPSLGLPDRGIGILGTGYGAAQGAITGGNWIPAGWSGVLVLATLAVVKIAATSMTLGSGGSGGDFGPSLAIGALVGGAFGRAAQLLISPTIDPGAFALVGMGTFYGGIAHVPLSSLVMVCELAGNYDLLAPLMLAEGIAFLLLRRVKLYGAQPTSRFESPLHAAGTSLDVLKRMLVRDVYRVETVATLTPSSSAGDIWRVLSEAPPTQDTFPVLDAKGAVVGLVSSDVLRQMGDSASLTNVLVAADIMVAPVAVRAEDDLHVGVERLLESGLREVPVLDAQGQVTGMLDEAHVTRAYHDYLERLQNDGPPESRTLA
ncbi:MAG: chloride channel protein [Polyangiaceae bacterium]